MPRYSQLSDWLVWLESLHPSAIDLGLTRVYTVAKALGLVLPPTDISLDQSGALAIDNTTVITVAGTNGKGSAVATMEQCLISQGHHVGAYTSPHLHHYCERIRINGQMVDESLVCDAFAAIDDARGDTSLTYFEFGTLAALWIFVQQSVPYVLLEVGLGGRLDAVNIIDADVAVVTSIAVDHEEWLGSDRETIAVEKLGVSRESKPVIIAELDPTNSLQAFSRSREHVYCINEHFTATAINHQQWSWSPDSEHSYRLPLPSLPLTSVAAALQVLSIIDCLPDIESLSTVLASLSLSGRYQQVTAGGRHVIFDVAHNPAAAIALSKRLATQGINGRTYAVFSAMADKALEEIISPLDEAIDHWYVSALAMDRGATSEQLQQALTASHIPSAAITLSASIAESFQLALTESSKHDRIIVFGSFFTVAMVQTYVADHLTQGE